MGFSSPGVMRLPRSNATAATISSLSCQKATGPESQAAIPLTVSAARPLAGHESSWRALAIDARCICAAHAPACGLTLLAAQALGALPFGTAPVGLGEGVNSRLEQTATFGHPGQFKQHGSTTYTRVVFPTKQDAYLPPHAFWPALQHRPMSQMRPVAPVGS
jgi:hypothetical protein